MLTVGKLDSDILQSAVIDKIKLKRPEVLSRAGIGEDCAVVDFGEYECVMSADPITAAVNEIGRLAVYISCNDVASNGIEPVGILMTALLPEGTTEEEIGQIMEQAAEAAADCGVEIIGGHTEVTRSVNQPIVIAAAAGRGIKGQSASASDAKVGDDILLTKQAGMEGTGIIAGDMADELRTFMSEEEISEAVAMLKDISVIKEGVIAGKIGTHGMHDVTEGGVLGAVWEMCHIAGSGAVVWEEKVPAAQVTRKICSHYGIDYLRLISSGCMLIISAPERTDEIMKQLKTDGIDVNIIGKILDSSDGLYTEDSSGRREIAPPGTDELYKVINR